MEKVKHNHSLTDILKVCLFSLLMIAPLFASISQMLYVTLNKNAKDSYSGQAITEMQPVYYETNEVNSVNDLVVGNLYYYTPTNTATSDTFVLCDLVKVQYGFTKGNFTIQQDVPYFKIYANNLLTLVYETSEDVYESSSRNSQIYFVFKNATKDLTPVIDNIRQCDLQIVKEYQEVVIESQTLDNAFYYGVDQMTKSNLFNWTQNTSIYTGVHAMTSGIGIESQFIPMLLTYWLVLTIVYIIIDVVIETFKYLTHTLQNKVKSKTS